MIIITIDILKYICVHCVTSILLFYSIDAAKHMWPEDLCVIYNKTKNLPTRHGYSRHARPYIYQEVIDLGGEGVSKFEYNNCGNVIEFQYGIILGNMFRKHDNLARLSTMTDPSAWNLMASGDSLTMIDNHDNQRGHGAGGASILTYKNPKEYKAGFNILRNYK